MNISVIGLRGFPMIEGGVERHCESLYPRLDKKINITIYRRKPYVKEVAVYDNISFIDLPSTKIKGFEAFIHSFFASVSAVLRKPDIVHYHNIGPALFSPIVKLRNIPVVLTYHSPNYEHKKWGRIARRILLFSEKVALKTADRIIFVNKFQMEKYDQKIKDKSSYIPNGISNLPMLAESDFLSKIGVEKGKYILSVGRITPEKGFDTLIKAYKIANVNNYKLVIAGGVEFESNYMMKLRNISDDKDVIFTGAVYGDDLYQLYSHAALFVLASRNEGFPLVLLEAMRYNLDVIVSDIPATHLVKLDEKDYFETGNYKMLADKMSESIEHFRKRKYDLSKYDWNVIAEKTEIVYCQVLDDAR